MARLKIPDGHTSVAHGEHSFSADDAGIIDTKNAPPYVVEHLLQYGGCREATDADVDAADAKIVDEDLKSHVIDTKSDVLAELKRRGVVGVDGRNTLKTLRGMLAADDERIAAQQASAEQSAAQQAVAQKAATDKIAADKAAADKAAADKAAADKAAADKAASDKAAADAAKTA